MVSDLPAGMDEDRVAAMCAALLSLGERAAEGLGRGMLNQVYIEGESGTVFLVACDEEAVLVAVAAAGAKAGMMLYEVRKGAQAIAEVLAADLPIPAQAMPLETPAPYVAAVPVYEQPPIHTPSAYAEPAPVTAFHPEPVETPPAPTYAPAAAVAADGEAANGWSSYAPSSEPTPWS
jgi:predicted regulator of Ras-like GTPase activity (Roadblock/LC7/MglB family)